MILGFLEGGLGVSGRPLSVGVFWGVCFAKLRWFLGTFGVYVVDGICLPGDLSVSGGGYLTL